MYVIEDANFLISVLKRTERFHSDAIDTLPILSNADVTYVYPQVVINETIFVLLRGGYRADTIRTRINKLSMIPRVIMQDTNPLTMLRYGSRYYNHISISDNVNQQSITGTNDFIIACCALDYNAVLISNDQRIIDVVKNAGIKCFDFTKESERVALKDFLQASC